MASRGLIILSVLTLTSLSLAERRTSCPVGYDQIDMHCFLVINTTTTIWEAVTACDIVDGKPVEIISQAEQERVRKYLSNTNTTSKFSYEYIWIGATHLQGQWLYLTSKNKNALKNFNAWAPSYPLLGQTYQHNCVILSVKQHWQWVNVPCSYHQTPLCEVRLLSVKSTF